MRSLRVWTAVCAALVALAPGLLRAQDEGPDAAPRDDVIVSDPPPELPAELAVEPAADPTPAAGPLVPPGGVPEVGGPVPGQPEQPEPEPEPPPPPIPPPIYSVEVQVRASFPLESSFDRALVALRYRSARVVPTGYVGMQVPLVDWLWVGGRLGIRGMSWRHLEREDATVVGADVLATAQLRFALGRILEIGLLFGGGLGWMNVQLGGANSDQATGRFVAEGIVAFRPDRHVAFGPRFGWEYFQWEGMNAYDHGLDVGGPFFGVALEGRE